MAQKLDYPDVFMQFRTISHQHHANLHTTLTESYIETGLEIRGGLAWLIHQVEIEYGAAEDAAAVIRRQSWAVSTRRGQAALPTFGERGCLVRHSRSNWILTSGAMESTDTPKVTFRPPVPIAARYLAAYFQQDADSTGLDGATSYIRVGYTTLKLTAKDYIELAEVWGE